MPRHFPNDPVPHSEASPQFTGLFLVAMLTAVILGFLCGLGWVVWSLLRPHLFR